MSKLQKIGGKTVITAANRKSSRTSWLFWI